ncbi:hypothetical protein IJT93_07705 [bacterium]|nr:hypothetical protein [bacterium]
MCSVYFKLALEEQFDKGYAEGLAIGKAEARLSSIRNVMKNMGWTAQKAMDALGIPAEEHPEWLAKINDPAAVPQPE